MTELHCHFRRATVEDLPRLRGLWQTALLPAQDLEKSLTEFQVVEGLDGRLMGALGFRVLGRNAWIYSEAYTHPNTEALVRPPLWNRLKVLATREGVFRIWTQEKAAFWPKCGFRAATADDCDQLPKPFQRVAGGWHVLTLRNETAEQLIEREVDGILQSAREEDQSRLVWQTKVIRWLLGLAVVGFCALLLYLAGLLF